MFGIALPRVRAVDGMNATELQAELVRLLADGIVRYNQSETVRARPHNRDFDPHFKTTCLEVPSKPVHL